MTAPTVGAAGLFVSLRDVTIRQGRASGQAPMLEDVSLTVRPGEVVCLLGRTGSGKSLLLSTFAGQARLAAGSAIVDGRVLKRPSGLARLAALSAEAPPPGRSVAVAVRRLSRLRRREAAAVVPTLLEELGVAELSPLRPKLLSPGGQAAVRLAGILLRRTRLLLIDDATLAGLDEPMRLALPRLLREAASDGRAVVFATRDARLALALADRVVLLDRGRIVQDGAPQALYERPWDARAARLLGPVNLLHGLVREARHGGFIWAGAPGGAERFVQFLGEDEARPKLGGAISLCLRPERIVVVDQSAQADNRVSGTVLDAGGAGASLRLRGATGRGELTALLPAWRFGALPEVGAPVTRAGASDAASVLGEDPRDAD